MNSQLVCFVCSSTDEKYISKDIGEDYTLARGAAVIEIIEAYKKVENLSIKMKETSKIEPTFGASELIAA